MTKKFFINTPPRTGTHMLANSISKSLNIPFLIVKDFQEEFTFEKIKKEFLKYPEKNFIEDHIFGGHGKKQDWSEALGQEYKIITAERHPLGQAVSILKYIKVRFDQLQKAYDENRIVGSESQVMSSIKDFLRWCPEIEGDEMILRSIDPNSELFISYVLSERFNNLRSITNDWSNGQNVINFDKILVKDKNEINKLNDLCGANIEIIDIKNVKKHFSQRLYTGNVNYWKSVISQETADKIAPFFPEYDFETFKNTSEIGNLIFKNSFDDIISKGFDIW